MLTNFGHFCARFTFNCTISINWYEVKIFSVATRYDPTSTLQSRNRAGENEESEEVEEIAEYSAAANGEK